MRNLEPSRYDCHLDATKPRPFVKGFFLSIGRCIFWILTDTINFYLFIKYKFRCIQIYKYRVDQPAPKTSLRQENRMQQPKGVDSRLIFKLEPFRGGFLRSTQIAHSPHCSKMVGICLQYHKIQRYWKIYKVCGKPSFCSRSAKSCAAAKAAVPGNGLPPAASKLAVSVASVQHPSSIQYTWICCEMSSETTDSVISSYDVVSINNA